MIGQTISHYRIDSLAVLPFANASGNPDAEYLSDGIAESLINSLSRLPKIKVMSRSASFRFKGRESDAQAAGRELGVRAVLTGRVVVRGDSLSISAELVAPERQPPALGRALQPKALRCPFGPGRDCHTDF